MDDYELLYYIYSNDEEAFNLLLEKHERNIFFAVKNALNAVSYKLNYSDEFKDLMNLAREEFYRSIFIFRNDGVCSFQSFMLRCVSMRIKKEVRHQRSNSNRQMSNAFRLDEYVKEQEGLYYVDMVENPHREFEGENILDPLNKNEIQTYLSQHLKFIEFQAATLYLNGYTQKEIALILGTNTRKVNYMCEKIKKTLIKYWSNENF